MNPPATRNRRTRHWIASLLGAGVLIEASRRARSHRVGAGEERLFRAANGAPDAVYPPVWAVMQSGSLGSAFLTGAVLHRLGRRDLAVAAVVASTAVWGGVKLVKPGCGRGRPERHLEDVRVRGKPQTGLGFPSGHAAVSMTLAIVATRDARFPLRAAAVSCAGLTGLARIYVGAHLPLDVAGGFAIGALAGHAASSAVDRF